MIRSSTISTLNVGTTGGLFQSFRHHGEFDRFLADGDERELPKSEIFVAAAVRHSRILDQVNDPPAGAVDVRATQPLSLA